MRQRERRDRERREREIERKEGGTLNSCVYVFQFVYCQMCFLIFTYYYYYECRSILVNFCILISTCYHYF